MQHTELEIGREISGPPLVEPLRHGWLCAGCVCSCERKAMLLNEWATRYHTMRIVANRAGSKFVGRESRRTTQRSAVYKWCMQIWPRREGASSTDKNIYAPLFSASTPFSGQACVGGTWARSRARERCAPCLRRRGGATHGAPYDAISFIHRSIGFSCSSVEAKRNQTRRDRAEGEVREEEGKKEREKETNKQTNKQTKEKHKKI